LQPRARRRRIFHELARASCYWNLQVAATPRLSNRNGAQTRPIARQPWMSFPTSPGSHRWPNPACPLRRAVEVDQRAAGSCRAYSTQPVRGTVLGPCRPSAPDRASLAATRSAYGHRRVRRIEFRTCPGSLPHPRARTADPDRPPDPPRPSSTTSFQHDIPSLRYRGRRAILSSLPGALRHRFGGKGPSRRKPVTPPSRPLRPAGPRNHG